MSPAPKTSLDDLQECWADIHPTTPRTATRFAPREPEKGTTGHDWHFIGHGGCDEEVWECRECGGRLVGCYYDAQHRLPPADLRIYSAVETKEKMSCEERQEDNKKHKWGDKSVWPRKEKK
jgi:hypothetical protein